MPDRPILASIDIGTNSTRLLVAECDGRKTFPVLREMRITRLGEGVDATGLLAPQAVLRTISVIEEYVSMTKGHLPVAVRAAATSALRDCQNREEFLESVEERCGLRPEILSGPEEARLSFLGAVSDVEGSGSGRMRFLVFDIGGGSTEIIVDGYGDEGSCGAPEDSEMEGSEKEFDMPAQSAGIEIEPERQIRVVSVDVGCVRMSERFLSEDPPSPIHLAKMETFIVSQLEPVVKNLCASKCDRAIGLAGTVTTVSAIVQGIAEYDSSLIHGSSLRIEDVERAYLELARMPLAKRRKVPGLDPGRADVIVGGIGVLKSIMRLVGFDNITVSEKDILDGMVIDLHKRMF